MTVNPQLFIQSVVEGQMMAGQADKTAKGPCPLITLSRDHGSGGNQLAEKLAEKLGIAIYDKSILDAVAKNAKVDKDLLAQLDDKVSGFRDGWIRSLLTGQDVFATSYRHHLVNVLLGLTQRGGIIVGRGAHVVLANRNVFRLRIIGSEGPCAERIAAREGLPIEKALEEVKRVNHERAKFVWDMFKRRLSEAHHFDLVINTDRMKDDWDTVTDLIVYAMQASCPLIADKGAKK